MIDLNEYPWNLPNVHVSATGSWLEHGDDRERSEEQ